jgi:hypothetical protein
MQEAHRAAQERAKQDREAEKQGKGGEKSLLTAVPNISRLKKAIKDATMAQQKYALELICVFVLFLGDSRSHIHFPLCVSVFFFCFFRFEDTLITFEQAHIADTRLTRNFANLHGVDFAVRTEDDIANEKTLEEKQGSPSAAKKKKRPRSSSSSKSVKRERESDSESESGSDSAEGGRSGPAIAYHSAHAQPEKRRRT